MNRSCQGLTAVSASWERCVAVVEMKERGFSQGATGRRTVLSYSTVKKYLGRMEAEFASRGSSVAIRERKVDRDESWS